MDQRNPSLDRLARFAESDLSTPPKERPTIGPLHPCENLHQGAFASAVFPDHSEDLPGHDMQTNLPKGLHPGKRLAQILDT
jgi:hypothetical protein